MRKGNPFISAYEDRFVEAVEVYAADLEEAEDYNMEEGDEFAEGKLDDLNDIIGKHERTRNTHRMASQIHKKASVTAPGGSARKHADLAKFHGEQAAHHDRVIKQANKGKLGAGITDMKAAAGEKISTAKKAIGDGLTSAKTSAVNDIRAHQFLDKAGIGGNKAKVMAGKVMDAPGRVAAGAKAGSDYLSKTVRGAQSKVKLNDSPMNKYSGIHPEPSGQEKRLAKVGDAYDAAKSGVDKTVKRVKGAPKAIGDAANRGITGVKNQASAMGEKISDNFTKIGDSLAHNKSLASSPSTKHLSSGVQSAIGHGVDAVKAVSKSKFGKFAGSKKGLAVGLGALGASGIASLYGHLQKKNGKDPSDDDMADHIHNNSDNEGGDHSGEPGWKMVFGKWVKLQ